MALATSRLRVVVLGCIVRAPLGGLAWHYLQYVLGLAALGHDVLFLEDSDGYPACFDPIRSEWTTDPAYGVNFIRETFERVGQGERWAYHDAHAGRWFGGAGRGTVSDFCATADVCLNVSGLNTISPTLDRVPVRVLVDTDPVFTQIRHLTDGDAYERASHHNAFFTFAENIAAPTSSVPLDGFAWQPTRQPIVLSAWPATPGPAAGPFTTVLLWESFDAREYDGRRYGVKSQSFAPYLGLPARVQDTLELALGGATAPRELLELHGWQVIDPRTATTDPWTYQRYLQTSAAEFSIAKLAYVETRCGWFSERSAAYLASGRPVVVQETGFSDWLPSKEGVVAFSSPDEAVRAIHDVRRRYALHCARAREIAESHFDAHTVLTRLLERAMTSSPLVSMANAKSDSP